MKKMEEDNPNQSTEERRGSQSTFTQSYNTTIVQFKQYKQSSYRA
jgi:hypothetical protein